MTELAQRAANQAPDVKWSENLIVKGAFYGWAFLPETPWKTTWTLYMEDELDELAHVSDPLSISIMLSFKLVKQVISKPELLPTKGRLAFFKLL